MASVDTEIASYLPTIEQTAHRLLRTRKAQEVGAEFDDLCQEGMIQVWQNLGRGVTADHGIEHRMLDWIRLLRKQQNPGIGREASYEQYLPIDSFDEEA